MPCFRHHQGIGEAHHMLPLRFTQTQVQTTQKGYKTGRMVYNELEQGGILSDLRFGLALLAYTDILLCSIWSFYKIRQTPGLYSSGSSISSRQYRSSSARIAAIAAWHVAGVTLANPSSRWTRRPAIV